MADENTSLARFLRWLRSKLPCAACAARPDADALTKELDRVRAELQEAERQMDACETCGPRRLAEWEAAQPDPTDYGIEHTFC